MSRTRLALVALLLSVAPAAAYVEAPMSFGSVIQQSTVICSMVVEKVDQANQLIVYRKVADIKGKVEQTLIKHNIGKNGLRPGEWQEIMNWAEVGKPALFFHNGSASETFTGTNWYQAYPAGEWWGMSHAEPFLLRSYFGKVNKCEQAVRAILAGQEVAVSCLVDGDKELLHKKTAKVQRLKASLKLLEYNAKRDFVGWGGAGDDVRKLTGWPGFEKLAAVGKTDADGQAVSVLDIDGDGKPDLCLCGANKLTLLLQGDDGFAEVSLPGFGGGARSVVWADYNGDGRPDLLLATPTGPRLYTNLGKAQFRDDTKLLPKEAGYNLTAAAWGDFDGDGKPDILLANGFHGLRVYLNRRPADAVAKSAPPKFGPWSAVGPFRHMPDPKKNFDTAFEPEKELAKDIDPAKKYKGKRDAEISWATKAYEDNGVVNLGEFGANCATYLYREIEAATATDLPLSLGSDDHLTVWLNGEKIASDNSHHNNQPCGPDQVKATLKLKAGKNRLVMKVCNNEGDYAYYFAAGQAGVGGDPWFTDASAAWGLGDGGLAADVKGDSLTVADFDIDGKPDFLFGAGQGMLFRNLGGRFELVNSGLKYAAGKVGPAAGDFDGDGLLDLFVPQTDGSCKLFKNLGGCKFADVTASSGDLAKTLGHAVGAAWGDFDTDGKPDLIVTCLKGPNRYFKNNGDGTFTDRTQAIGLHQKVFNTQAAAFADVNADGKLDLILLNEGQESAVLYGVMPASGRTAVTVKLPATAHGAGEVVSVSGADGKAETRQLVGGDGRGGQGWLTPRFALTPGNYTVSVRGTDGKTKTKSVTVGTEPLKVAVE